MPDSADQHIMAFRKAMTDLENALAEEPRDREAILWCVNELVLAAEAMQYDLEQAPDE